MMPPKQPKINQKLVLRTAVGLLALAVFIFAFQYLRGKKGDIADIGTVNSVGWVAAVEQQPDGSQVVYFDNEGNVHRSPGHTKGSSEDHPVWRPDGNRIYFSSDRENSIYQIYRWNLANGNVENRAPSRVARTSPEVDPFDANSLLFIQSGLGYKLDVAAAKAIRVFPPVETSRQGGQPDDNGEGGTLKIDYDLVARYRLRQVKWLDKNWLLGIQRLETGEALVAQSTELRDDDTMQPYVVLVTGAKIVFDIVPETGEIFCGVAGYRLNDTEPDEVRQSFLKGAKMDLPFTYALLRGGLEDYAKGIRGLTREHILVASKKNDEAISSVAVSPDSKWVAVCRAQADPAVVVRPTALAVFPVERSSGPAQGLLEGPVYDPSWSPDSNKIVFAMPEGEADRLIYTISRTGGTPARVSPDHGVYSVPQMSPQK